MKIHLLIPALFIGMAAPAHAADSCAMTYETFESAVPHLDLETCPAGLTDAKAFCRAAVGGHELFVYVFAEEGDKCLLTVKSFDSYELTVK